MKIDRDEFVIRYDATRIDEKQILGVCEKSGFPATILPGDKKPDATIEPATDAEDYTPPEFYRVALESASRENKPVVLDFMATWCAPCKRISNETFVEENVAKLLEDCILLKIDTDEFPELAKHFDVSVLPDLRLLNPDGTQHRKLGGFQDAKPFASELRELLDQVK